MLTWINYQICFRHRAFPYTKDKDFLCVMTFEDRMGKYIIGAHKMCNEFCYDQILLVYGYCSNIFRNADLCFINFAFISKLLSVLLFLYLKILWQQLLLLFLTLKSYSGSKGNLNLLPLVQLIKNNIAKRFKAITI